MAMHEKITMKAYRLRTTSLLYKLVTVSDLGWVSFSEVYWTKLQDYLGVASRDKRWRRRCGITEESV